MQDYALRLDAGTITAGVPAGNAITTSRVSEHTLAAGSTLSHIFSLKCPVIKILVKVAAGGMDSGMHIDFRADTDATMTAAPIIMARRTVMVDNLPAGAMIQIPIPPTKLPALYDSFGLYYRLVNEAATGLKVIAWIGEAGESADAEVYDAI